MLDQQAILQRYQSGIGAGGQKWLQGIQGLTVNPAQQAASPQGMANWLQGVQNSVAKRQASLNRVTLADIQQAAQSYGQANYTNSATKATAKYGKKLPGMMALWQAQSAAAKAIPHSPGNMGSAMQRVQAVIQLAINARGKI